MGAMSQPPCPIREADVRSYVKETRLRRVRMQPRTRTLAPVLPQLVAAAEERARLSLLVLHAARHAAAGEEFTVEQTRYRRTGRNDSHWRPTAVFVTALSDNGPRWATDIARAQELETRRRADVVLLTIGVNEVPDRRAHISVGESRPVGILLLRRGMKPAEIKCRPAAAHRRHRHDHRTRSNSPNIASIVARKPANLIR